MSSPAALEAPREHTEPVAAAAPAPIATKAPNGHTPADAGTNPPAPEDTAVETAPLHPAVRWSTGEKWLLGGGILSGTSLGGLGLASSYRALEKKAALPAGAGGWGWGPYAWMLPIGVDLGILTFSIINLLLVKAEKPLAWVKWVPRLLTFVTIVLNWNTGATLEGKLGHAALAALWVFLSEIAAHLYAAHIGRLKGRSEMERIRFVRWLFDPIGSARVNRQMKTFEITSYNEALARDRAAVVYRSGLRQKYGRLWRFNAPEEKLQPLRLYKFGMTIEEALEEPYRQEDAEELRTQKRDLQRAKARVQKIEAESQVDAAELQAEAAKVRAASNLDAAKAEADAAASVRVQQAETDLQVRQAEAEAEMKRLAAEAQARVKELENEDLERQAERARQQERDQLNWEKERAQLLANQRAEQAQRSAEAELKESAEAAKARRIKEEEERAAAVAEQDAAEARRQTAEAELKAEQDRLNKAKAESEANALERQAAEDSAAAAAARLKASADELKAAEQEAEARITPAEREARKIAELISAEGLRTVTLTRIESDFGVSQGTASNRRRRAIQILQEKGELPAEIAS